MLVPFPEEIETLLSTAMSRPDLEPSQPPVKYVLGGCIPAHYADPFPHPLLRLGICGTLFSLPIHRDNVTHLLYPHAHFMPPPFRVGSRDSTVGIATGYGLDGQGAEVWVSSLLFQTDSGTQPDSYPISTSGLFPRSKAAWTHSPPTSAEVNNTLIYTSTSPYVGIVLNRLSIGRTLPFTLTFSSGQANNIQWSSGYGLCLFSNSGRD
jgi:hypothetical protein